MIIYIIILVYNYIVVTNSSCSGSAKPCMYLDPSPNPNILFGGLVGGPDIIDNYEDKRSNYVQNEVALDFNAGFQSALAGKYCYTCYINRCLL